MTASPGHAAGVTVFIMADRRHNTRAFGSSSENDDLLAALEASAVDHARLAKPEELVRLAFAETDEGVVRAA